MEKIHIAIVDDHPLYRMGIKSVITETIPEANVVGDYNSAEEFFVAMQKNLARPNIILLDILMDGINGIDMAKILKKEYPEIKIIILSSEVDKNTVLTMVDIGVDGYLSKMSVEADLKKAIINVSRNIIFYGKDISYIIYDIWHEKKQDKTKIRQNSFLKIENSSNDTLTTREYDIIEMLCDGCSSGEIGERLYISPRTVERHRANIMKKLGFHNTIELVKYAIIKGIVSL